MTHRHTWHLAEYYNSRQFVVNGAKYYQPPTANWICPCGKGKLVEVTDLQPSDPETKSRKAEAK